MGEAEIQAIIKWIEQHPTTIAGVVGLLGIFIPLLKRKNKENPYASPAFWTFGRKYRISAVCPQFPDDSSPTGWRQEQYSRPDQWNRFIKIDSIFFGFRHRISLHDPNQRLFLNISRNGNEREKVIRFNF